MRHVGSGTQDGSGERTSVSGGVSHRKRSEDTDLSPGRGPLHQGGRRLSGAAPRIPRLPGRPGRHHPLPARSRRCIGNRFSIRSHQHSTQRHIDPPRSTSNPQAIDVAADTPVSSRPSPRSPSKRSCRSLPIATPTCCQVAARALSITWPEVVLSAADIEDLRVQAAAALQDASLENRRSHPPGHARHPGDGARRPLPRGCELTSAYVHPRRLRGLTRHQTQVRVEDQSLRPNGRGLERVLIESRTPGTIGRTSTARSRRMPQASRCRPAAAIAAWTWAVRMCDNHRLMYVRSLRGVTNPWHEVAR